MTQKLTGEVDSTYSARSHSYCTLKHWHCTHPHVSKIAISSEFIVTVFAILFVALYMIYRFHCEPYKAGKEMEKQIASNSPETIRAEGQSKVWTTFTISTLITTGTVIADGLVIYQYKNLRKEVKDFTEDKLQQFVFLHDIPYIMMGFDVLAFLFAILALIVCCLYRCSKRYYEILLYSPLSPLMCLAAHSYHIIIAFVSNPYHATSVLLLYIMTLILQIVVFQKIYYYVYNLSKCKYCKQNKLMQCQCCIHFCVSGFNLLAIITIGVSIALTVALFIVLPIKNSLDQASNQIYAISVTVFAALVTFKVVFGETNSIFEVLMKAADKFGSPQKNWGDMSEKEKEIYLGEKLLSHIGFELPRPPLTLSEDNSFFCHCPCCCDIFEQPSPDQPCHCHPSCCSFRTRSNQYVRLATEDSSEQSKLPKDYSVQQT